MKNIKLFFVLFIMSLFIACTNSITPENISSGRDISFTLSDDVASEIARTLQKNNNVDNNSQVKIGCQLVGISSQEISKNILLKDIGGTRFSFSAVPFNVEFRAKVSILYEGSIIYEGFSEPNKVTSETSDISIKLIVEKKPCKITYQLNNSEADKGSNPTEYFIDSQVSISDPSNRNANLDFGGWYTEADFSGDRITSLGADNFLGDVTLYGRWVYNGYLKKFDLTRGDKFIELTLEYPVADDFSKVVISCSGLADVIEITDKAPKKKITLDNGKKYKFTVKTVNKDGFESMPVSFIGETWYALTEDVEFLALATDGSFGKGGEYVLFGDFPQTKKATDVQILPDTTEDVNNTSYFMGDDGYYYESIDKISGGQVTSRTYYKVEPIKWRVLTDGYVDGSGNVKGKLLMAENALTSIDFYESAGATANRPGNVFNNNYKYSNVRAYLNSLDGSSYDAYNYSQSSRFRGFIDSAFSTKAQSKLVEVEVDNSVGSTGQVENQYICENTKDKIFLMSYAELTNPEFGFNTDGNASDSKRSRKVTDYSKDKVDNNIGIVDTAGNVDYWLRSPSNSREAVRVFIDHNNDNMLKQYLPSNLYGRVVPAIVVN